MLLVSSLNSSQLNGELCLKLNAGQHHGIPTHCSEHCILERALSVTRGGRGEHCVLPAADWTALNRAVLCCPSNAAHSMHARAAVNRAALCCPSNAAHSMHARAALNRAALCCPSNAAHSTHARAAVNNRIASATNRQYATVQRTSMFCASLD